MTRRSISTLLGILALSAAGILWIWVSVIDGPSVEESTSVVPALEGTTPGPSDPPLASSPSPETDLPVGDATPTTRAAVPQAHREDAALPAAELELRDALWVEGRVVVPHGTPHDELVEVIANGTPYETRPLHSSPIAADGSFRVAFAPGTHLGTLDLTAKYLYLEQAITVSPAQPPPDILLTPRLGGRIHGQVMLSPAALTLRSSIVGSSGRAQRTRSDPIRTGEIDEQLEFDIQGLPAGPNYEVRVAAPGANSIPLRGVQVEPGRITFVDVDVDPAAAVSGRVFDAGGTAANGAQIVARNLGEASLGSPRRDFHQTLSDPSGRFVFPDIPPSEWELTATGLGFAKSLPHVVHLSAGRSVEEVRLELRRSGRIAGRVLGVDGEPALYASVYAISTRAAERELEGTEFWSRNSRTTDKYGDFEFDGLSPGTYRIETRWSDSSKGGEASRSGIELSEGECVEALVIRIERPGRIEGRVIGPEGRPAGEVVVFVTDEDAVITDSPFAKSAKSDESGKFTFDQVEPGEHRLVVRDGKLVQVGETRVALRPGEVVQAEISVEAGALLSVALHGFGEDAAAVTVSIVDEHGVLVVTASPQRLRSSKGRGQILACTLGPLRPGKYAVEAVSGDKRASQAVTISGLESESILLRAGD